MSDYGSVGPGRIERTLGWSHPGGTSARHSGIGDYFERRACVAHRAILA